MATTQITEFTDDLSGGSAEGTVEFGYKGVNYEIDLSTLNADKLEKSLEKYIAKARVVKAAKAPKAKAGRKAAGTRAPAKASASAAVRAWGEMNGFPGSVGARGALPKALREAYEAAHPAVEIVEAPEGLGVEFEEFATSA